ncbi:MAG: malate/lactate/ureidoglycolate dehydrogenase [Actinomycetia bacterium]|nr:malate/lactate/ureidoglycolate dehydrogenase [Actinomycetes bacterium]MCP4960065.1 malate/lactate/ureidoglycolate dehydrogenase [Actinomycetes bacterium]
MIEIAPDDLHNYVRQVCEGLGSDEREQHLVADQLIGANLTGHDSHGVGMMPTYVGVALGGKVTINGGVRVVRDDGAIVVLDGGSAFGQVTGHEATLMAIERGREHGLAMVGLRNSFHIGRIGHWGELCADAGLVSIHFVNVVGHPGLVAPHGSRRALIGTNPVCIAVPAGPGAGADGRIVLDMATSIIALGKARVANLAGTRVPTGSIVDADGDLTDDPSAMFAEPQGALVTMGDHKGSGLALMCELLGAALFGGPTTTSCEEEGTIINNMLTLVVDPAATGDLSSMRILADDLVSAVRDMPTRRGVDEVFMPGDPERLARRERADTIPIDDGTAAQLRWAAKESGSEGAAELIRSVTGS